MQSHPLHRIRFGQYTRPHQLRWGDREMGTAISCTICSQVAGLIFKSRQRLLESTVSSWNIYTGLDSLHSRMQLKLSIVQRTIVLKHLSLRSFGTTTYLQCSSDHQGLDSTRSQCTQLSSFPLAPDLGHSCRTPLNLLLCQCSSPEIHSVAQQVDHSQLHRGYV